jgi:hypothetical protein
MKQIQRQNQKDSGKNQRFIIPPSGVRGLFIFLFISIFSFVKADEIQKISDKYRSWIVGSASTDYSNPLVEERFKAIMESAQKAHEFYNTYDFSNLEPYDFESKKNAEDKVKSGKVEKPKNDKSELNSPKKIFSDMLFPLALAYQIKGNKANRNPDYHSRTTLKIILDIFEYLNKRGWVKGVNIVIKTSNYKENGFVEYGGSDAGLGGLGYTLSVFLMQEELKSNGVFDTQLQMVDWMSQSVGPAFDTPILWEEPGFNADGIRAIFNQRLCYIFSLSQKSPEREKEMLYFQKMMNKSLKIANSWNDMIKPDYIGYHHKNPYMSAYPVHGFHSAAIYCYLLNNTKYQVSDEVVSNLSNALLAYRIYSNKYDVPRSVTGRFPNKLNTLQENIPAYMYMANLNTNPLCSQLKSAFMRLWNPNDESFKREFLTNVKSFICYFGSIGALEECNKLVAENVKPESDPNGYWFYPYAGMTIYRQQNWMAGWKGVSKYIWDYEGTAVQNRYGRFNGSGVLQIYASGNPVSAAESGYEIDGWNWCRLPGATTFDMPADVMFTGKHRNFVTETFLGGVKFNDCCGLSAMSYQDPQSSLCANKSLFFVDNYIVALGSDISSTNEIYSVQTTIAQVGIGSGSSISYFNNKAVKGFSTTLEATEGKPLGYVDAKGHSYYFPKGANLTFARAEQNEPLERGKVTKAGNYETCRIIHGINPQSAGYQYVIAINGGEKETKNLEQNFDKLFRVDQQDAVAHIVTYLPENATAYAVRKAGNKLKSNLLKSVDTPCMFVLKSVKQTCVLSLSNPEFGRTDKFYTFSQVDRENPEIFKAKSQICPVRLVLKGEWKLEKESSEVKIIVAQDTETVIQFNCFDGKTISIQLIQK